MALVDSVGPDIEQIPTPLNKKGSAFWGAVKDILLVVFFSFCVFIFINFPAITLIGTYKLFPQKLAYEFGRPHEDTQAVVLEQPVVAPEVFRYSDNSIFIPKIGVKAPIGWDTKNNEITDALEKNVIHLQDTDKPGGKGNIFLTGHSSNYWWKNGDYNTVFALLPELEENDEIIITYKGQFFYYRVTSKEEMKKDEVASRLESDKPKLTIMTCVPVGTNLKRLLVYAEPEK